MDRILDILNYSFQLGEGSRITVKTILVLIVLFIIASVLLKLLRKLVTRKLPIEDTLKFVSVFNYVKYFIFLIILLSVLGNNGVKINAILTGAAALLIGVGLALQTLFQDIISGISILLDQSVHVNDIIEVDGKLGRVISINLRTTKAVTIENKILIIPNHLYLTNTLYNYTQNEANTRESVSVGVAYGTDVELVKKILLQAADNLPQIFKKPEPVVFFTDFGDSALSFKLVFTINDSFLVVYTQSDLRFEINRLFKAHDIRIPFPQRDIHIIDSKK